MDHQGYSMCIPRLITTKFHSKMTPKMKLGNNLRKATCVWNPSFRKTYECTLFSFCFKRPMITTLTYYIYKTMQCWSDLRSPTKLLGNKRQDILLKKIQHLTVDVSHSHAKGHPYESKTILSDKVSPWTTP